jgi:hypothetical protein
VENTITFSKKDERTNNEVINIGGQHITLSKKEERTNNEVISIGGQHNNFK